MRIGIPAETRPRETRVAATPETIRKLTAGGLHQVLVQAGAGTRASVTDQAHTEAGAQVLPGAAEVYAQAELVFKGPAPTAEELDSLRPGQVLVGMLSPFDRDGLAALAARGVTASALEAAPRITRAQSLDVLSSQANIAGYKAVLVAANAYQRFMPMLMTAAGTVKAARVVVLGAGVAGLQAI